MYRHRLEHQVPGNVVEKFLDVQIDHPVGFPTPLPALAHRVQRRTTRAIAVRIVVEHRLDSFLQFHGHHRLSHPVGHRGNTQHPGPRHGASVSPPHAPAAESNCPRTSGGGSGTGAVALIGGRSQSHWNRTVSRRVVHLCGRGPIVTPFPAPARQSVHAVVGLEIERAHQHATGVTGHGSQSRPAIPDGRISRVRF